MRTDQTLLEQMRISDVDIEARKEILGLTREELTLLADQKIHIENNIDIIVAEFYTKQTEIDEITLVIGDADTLSRLRFAQRRYVLDMFSGHYDGDYVNNRLRIGMIHKRIGVAPRLYLAAVRTLHNIVTKILIKSIQDEDILAMTLEAIDKLVYFDTTLVFDAYIDSLVGEIENAKAKTELYAENLEEKVAIRTKQLQELAKTDPLTGLYNQRAMYSMLRRDLNISRRQQNVLSVIYFDIDSFKAINDKQGHLVGDEVLKYIGQSLRQIIREVDIPCRFGGDEFCLILPDCARDDARVICGRIIKDFHDQYPHYNLSMGIAEALPDANLDGESLIKIADEKMYLAKKTKGSAIES